MINLSNYFKLQFDDPKLSDERIAKFAEVALARLQNNNPEGQFTALIAPLNDALTLFRAKQSEKSIYKAQREGTTVTVDSKMDEFRKLALQREGLIRDLFGTDSREYQEFYPLGTHEYTKMNKTNAEMLMNRMIAAYTTYNDRLPEGRLDEFTKLFNEYKAARAEQLEKAAGVSGKVAEKTSGRAALEMQLQKNLLTLALAFMGQPEMYMVYFEPSLLKPYRHSSRERSAGTDDDEDGSYTLELEPMSTRRAEFTVAAGELLNLYNGGDTPLSVYTAVAASDPMPANSVLLEPDEEMEVNVNDIGPAGAGLLMVNNNTNMAGSISIAMI